MGLKVDQKLRKFQIFGNNLPRRIPLNYFNKKLGVEDELPGPHSRCSGFKNGGLQPPKLPKFVIFVINFTKRGISP